jgi:hypothetical protein
LMLIVADVDANVDANGLPPLTVEKIQGRL